MGRYMVGRDDGRNIRFQIRNQMCSQSVTTHLPAQLADHGDAAPRRVGDG